MVSINNSQSGSLYRIGGTLAPDEPTYVTRTGDKELYSGLKIGDFCYVLNSRQMGKSSLAMRVQQELESSGLITAYIDLQDIARTEEERWYNGIIHELADELSCEISIDWKNWLDSVTELSPVQKLSHFLEKIILESRTLQEAGLVIFIDEIDYVRTLDFSTDSFFTLIRSCYNARAQKPKYNALTFCLLGVATPSDLIDETHITPFNIGTAITLKGFTIEEAKPLIDGLANWVEKPSEVMKEILDWTGGQPFLTQRLCDLVVNQKQPTPDLTEIVQRNILDNWDDPEQDKQEHLRTIRNRILSEERRASLVLELYRNVLKESQVTVTNRKEETELKLSGLVVKKGNVLQVYNPIYALVFNDAWIDASLAKLRPYSESYRAWLQSGKTDESRLLRGQALVETEEWASGKNIGGEDRDFLGASRAKQRAEEIEQKDKDATKKRNKMLALGISLSGAILLVSGGLIFWAWRERDTIKANIKLADELSQQAGILQQKNYTEASLDALAQAGLSLTLKDPELKQALSWSGIALTHQYLGQRSLETEDNKPIKEIKYNEEQLEHWQKAQEAIINSLKLLKKEDLTSTDVVPVAFFTYSVLGNLLEEHQFAKNQLQQELLTTSIFPSTYPKTALDAYKKALSLPEESSPPVAESPDLETIDNVRNVYRELSESLSFDSDTDKTRKQRDNLRNLMLASLKKHYLYLTHARILALETALKELDWKQADGLTWDVIWFSGQSKNIESFWTWRNTSCSDFRKIETLWYNQSNGTFSFKEQWKIYYSLNNDSPYYDEDAYSAFIRDVGWYTEGKGWKNYEDLNWSKNSPKTSPN